MHLCHAAYKTGVAFVSSLKEVSVADVRTPSPPLRVPTSLEPVLVALGSMHLAAASVDGRVAFHRCLPDDLQRVGPELEYGKVGLFRSPRKDAALQSHTPRFLGPFFFQVKALALNDKYAAVLSFDGTLTLHEIEPGLGAASPGPNPYAGQPRRKVFPDGGESPSRGGRKFSSGNAVTAVALTRSNLPCKPLLPAPR
jgi:hypothetical protein